MSQNNIHVLSRAIIIDQNHILLCHTQDLTHNFYFLPGGHIEHGESAIDALHRELIEESGYEFEITRFMGCFEHHFEPGRNSVCHNHEYNFIFEATSKLISFQAEIPQVENHIKLEWISLERLADIDFRPAALKQYLPIWLSENNTNALKSVMLKK